jgi:hypothetical protein
VQGDDAGRERAVQRGVPIAPNTHLERSREPGGTHLTDGDRGTNRLRHESPPTILDANDVTGRQPANRDATVSEP